MNTIATPLPAAPLDDGALPLLKRVALRYLPLLFVLYVVAIIDRVNVGFAKLQMQQALQFSDVVYGLGAGIFFIGYFLFEVPSNLILERVGAKMLLNALSTCTMVRLGRVLGNRMICLVPRNLKLIDRSTRYIRDLAGVSYEKACHALFEVIEYVEPRRRAGQAYPAPVGVATMRLRHGLGLERAEARLAQELG